MDSAEQLAQPTKSIACPHGHATKRLAHTAGVRCLQCRRDYSITVCEMYERARAEVQARFRYDGVSDRVCAAGMDRMRCELTGLRMALVREDEHPFFQLFRELVQQQMARANVLSRAGVNPEPGTPPAASLSEAIAIAEIGETL